MKAIAYMKPGIELVEIPEPTPNCSDYVKIKAAYAGICGSDIHILNGGYDAIIPDGPFPIGHETTGVVVELGPDATEKGLKIGDKVTYYLNKYCGKCHFCKSGQEHLCTNVYFYASSMCEYFTVSEAHVWKLPDNIDLLKGAITEPISFCLHVLDLAQLKSGDTAVISGGGAIGLVALLLAKRMGLSKLTVIEPVAEKRQMALDIGARYVIDPVNEDVEARVKEITDGRGFDGVFECSGAKQTIQPCLSYASAGATIVYAAMYGGASVEVDLNDLFEKELKITAPHQAPYTWERAISIVGELEDDLDLFTNCVFSMEDYKEAFRVQKESKFAKVIIKIDDSL